jgi:hypothetical protein
MKDERRNEVRGPGQGRRADILSAYSVTSLPACDTSNIVKPVNAVSGRDAPRSGARWKMRVESKVTAPRSAQFGNR